MNFVLHTSITRMRPPFTGVSTLSGNVDVAPNGVFLFVGLLVRSRTSTTHTVSHERAAPLIGDATSPWWRRMLENGGGGGRSNVVVLHPSVRHWLLRSITHRSIRGRWLHLFRQTLPGASVPSGYHQRRVSMPAIRVIAPLPSIATTALRTDDRFERPAAARENYARRISRGNSSRSLGRCCQAAPSTCILSGEFLLFFGSWRWLLNCLSMNLAESRL